MNRRTLLKLMALFPLAGPTIVKALAKSESKSMAGYDVYLPSHFPKWDTAIDGLESAGQWAQDLERARLPTDMDFPRGGQIWEAIRDCEVHFHPCYSKKPTESGHALAMFGGQTRLAQGEKVVIVGSEDPKPLYIRFSLVRNRELEESIVTEEMRRLPGYQGYELQAKTVRTISDFDNRKRQTYFHEAFRLVENTSPSF
jgi:hypothetical protein